MASSWDWFSRKRQHRDRKLQLKEEPTCRFLQDEDTLFCRCGSRTLACYRCGQVYCPCCELCHVQTDVQTGELFWACECF